MDSYSNGPGTNPHWYEHWKITPALHSLKQDVVGDVSSVLWVVMGTIVLVLLITHAPTSRISCWCAPGSPAGTPPFAPHWAPDAARIARELLTESVLLGLVGGGLGIGVAVAAAGLRLLAAIGPVNLPRLSEISLDAWSLALHAWSLALFGIVLRVDSGVEVWA